MWQSAYVDQYFPYMYGMLELEISSKRLKRYYLLPDMKKDFMSRYIDYCEKNSIFYIEEELNKILNFDIEEEYVQLLLDKFKIYRDNQTLKDIVAIAEEINGRGQL